MNAALPFLDARRAEAIESFRVQGVPHRRIEDWKYSDLKSALADNEIPAAGSASWHIAQLPENVEIVDLAKLDGNIPAWIEQHLGAAAGNVMDAAATGYARSGVALRIARKKAADQPLRLEFSGNGHSLLLLVVEEGASLTLVETQKPGKGLRNIGAHIALGANARLSHIVIADHAPEAIHVESLVVSTAQHARYSAHFANAGARLSRTSVTVSLDGPGAEATLSGTATLGGDTHADVTTHIVHATGHTKSTQLFKYAAGGHSRAVYQGRVTVREGADDSDSRQTAKGILLGPRAEIDLKPELEIFADDVKCAHGAAIGDLEAEQLFYLQARGIAQTEARNLLIRAFLEDAVFEIADETIRAEAWGIVEAALPRATESAS
jgi:Fe-S cluster assembly protein SufD